MSTAMQEMMILVLANNKELEKEEWSFEENQSIVHSSNQIGHYVLLPS